MPPLIATNPANYGNVGSGLNKVWSAFGSFANRFAPFLNPTAYNAQFNANQAKIQREFASNEAQKNRDFQERMSNTAYSRAISDLKRNGLNPYLAFGAPASTPSGSAFSGSSASSSGGASAQMLSSVTGYALNQLNRIADEMKISVNDLYTLFVGR
ncbi:DNA pilot protein [Microvirus mar11]|uniref:DNA pilot protein n=1 Tax=Microvirus mar11 TaxID=2851143 RepID=A0A8F6AIX3_9VIRU|nr:DNA pilot protein [Microvirus mar11]